MARKRITRQPSLPFRERNGALFDDIAKEWVTPAEAKKRIEERANKVVDLFGYPAGGSYMARRSKDGKIIKLSLITAKRILDRGPQTGMPRGDDFEALWWVRPDWTKAGEAKWRVQSGWGRVLWDWARGRAAEPKGRSKL